MSRWQWVLAQFTRRLWVRSALFSMLGALTALVAILLRPFISSALAERIGADSVDNILGIMASSMLAVTTFSLGAMVSAYAGVAGSVTPRATTLLLQDTKAQNALSTFIGAFLFSIVGIVALSTGSYGPEGRAVLFIVTVVVIGVVVVTLLRWIEYLSRLGRLGETTKRVEEAAAGALRERRRHPHMGALPPPDAAPAGGQAIHGGETGYLQHLDVAALDALAQEAGGRIDVCVLPGTFVAPETVLARATAPLDEEGAERARRAFSIGDMRSFDQDPRFGLAVLAEIASRALSSATNDPGTAIDVIGRTVRVLSIWAEPGVEEEPRCQNVTVPALETRDLFDDLFITVARDGAQAVEIGIRLQKGLAMLATAGDGRLAPAALHHSELAAARALAALSFEPDRRLIVEQAEAVRAAAARA
ncbi:DUF2254 domain-containing protein [Bosea sp. TWI1241]|uniref:DUF2254 domain-containing protein n=1 Tax=Bosea sp. TWI1241 TaxID=3148904 RepID=UPI0032089F07